MNLKKWLIAITVFLTGALSFQLASQLAAQLAFAHAVVSPDQANIGEFTRFSLGVPNEREVTVSGVKLAIPVDLQSVTPNAKPGWNITVSKNGTGEDAPVTEIFWDSGTIPVGQRDEFVFNAKVPSTPTTLQWKVTQTYIDGTVVTWDQSPAAEEQEASNKGPYSETQVVNDLSAAPAPIKDNRAYLALILSIVALVVSLSTLARRNKPNQPTA